MNHLVRYFETQQLAQKGYVRALEGVCRKWQLTRSELDVLLFLANNPEFDRAADIAAHRGIAKSHVSLSVTKLENRGLLCCREDPRDRRSVRLELTEQAWSVARDGQAAQGDFFDRVFSGITREELAQWQETEEKIRRNVVALET